MGISIHILLFYIFTSIGKYSKFLLNLAFGCKWKYSFLKSYWHYAINKQCQFYLRKRDGPLAHQ